MRDLNGRVDRLERHQPTTRLPVELYDVWDDGPVLAQIIAYYRAHLTPEELAHEADFLAGYSDTIAAGRWWSSTPTARPR